MSERIMNYRESAVMKLLVRLVDELDNPGSYLTVEQLIAMLPAGSFPPSFTEDAVKKIADFTFSYLAAHAYARRSSMCDKAIRLDYKENNMPEMWNERHIEVLAEVIECAMQGAGPREPPLMDSTEELQKIIVLMREQYDLISALHAASKLVGSKSLSARLEALKTNQWSTIGKLQKFLDMLIKSKHFSR
jgi:hypothetical protein